MTDYSQIADIESQLKTALADHDFDFSQEAASNDFLKNHADTTCGGIPTEWAEPPMAGKIARGCADFAGVAKDNRDCVSAAKNVLLRRMYTECVRRGSTIAGCGSWVLVLNSKLLVAKDGQGKWHVGGSICFFE